MSDTSDLDKLAADLAVAGARMRVAGAALTTKGALNIKNDWRASAAGLKHAPLYPNSISFDLATTASQISAEIGPDKDKPQGSLGNLIEYGSSHNPPHLDGNGALAAEDPRFEAAAADAAEQSVLG